MPRGMLRVLTIELAGDLLRVITGKDYTPFFEANFPASLNLIA